MNAKAVFFLALCIALGNWGAVFGQDYGVRSNPVSPPAEDDRPASTEGPAPSRGLSTWITGAQPCLNCMGPWGGNGPIGSEVFLRAGPSILTDGHYMDRVLAAGWMIEGGAKTLFFNLEQDAAWTVHFGISNNTNRGDLLGAKTNPAIINGTKAIVAEFDRTYVNVGLGREWYLNAPNSNPGLKWRFGLDSGGRYGTGYITFRNFPHDNDVIGGVFTACFTDVEFPICYDAFIVSVGIRTEWAYTWSDILDKGRDIQDINVLASIGVRF